MPKPSAFNLLRLVSAFNYSCQGLKAAWRNEAAIRQEILAGCFFVPLAFWLAQSGVELALLLLAMGLVFLAELTNTAIEFTVDRVGLEKHPLAGQAKDVGSALVLSALILMILIWAAVLIWR
jgi:diacylglycerol kinase (ATP)